MDWGKVIYVFFSLMSLTSIIGYLYEPKSSILLFIALCLNLVSTILKIGVKNLLAAELFAASLVADLHLMPAAYYEIMLHNTKVAISLSIGALLANIVAFIFVTIELAKTRDEFE